MDKYLLTLMVTFEQEYAIQKLFGRHGWEYSRIDEGTSLTDVKSNEILSSETQHSEPQQNSISMPSISSNWKTVISNSDKDITDTSKKIKTNVDKIMVKTGKNNILNNIMNAGDVNKGFENSLSSETDMDDADNNDKGDCDDDYDGETDSEQNLESLGITIKKEVESDDDDDDDDDKTSGHFTDTVSNVLDNKEASGILKRGAQTRQDIRNTKKRKQMSTLTSANYTLSSAVRKDNSDRSEIEEVKLEELSAEDEVTDDPLTVLETLPDIEHLSNIVTSEAHDAETLLTGPSDVDDSGYSASLSVYFCKDCKYTFPDEKYYTLHKRSGKCVFPCQFCDEKFTFKNFSMYQEHLKQHRIMYRQTYTEQDILKAVSAVRQRRLSQRKASIEFGVPRTTIRYRCRQTTVTNTRCSRTQLTSDEEGALVKYMTYMANQGLPLSRNTARRYIQDIISRSGRSSLFNERTGPSDKWFRRFFMRYPELSERKAENTDGARATMSISSVVSSFFDLLRTVLDKNGLLNKPAQIFNCDETDWSGKEAPRTRKKVSNTDVTAHLCISASGLFLPTMVIFQGSLPDRQYNDGVPDSWLFGRSDSGYMDTELFHKWFTQLFIPHCGKSRPVLLILDNHDSHISIPVIEAALENEIVLLGLPPQATHILQPIDVKVIGPLKSRFSAIASNLGFFSIGLMIEKSKFPVVLRHTIDQSTPASIQDSFNVTGICPYNPAAVDKTQLIDPTFPKADGGKKRMQEN